MQRACIISKEQHSLALLEINFKFKTFEGRSEKFELHNDDRVSRIQDSRGEIPEFGPLRGTPHQIDKQNTGSSWCHGAD